jgi:hypothetical protein
MKWLLVLWFFLVAAAPQSLLAAPVVLFDEGHGQPFLVRGERPLDLSALAGVFTAAGCEVRTSGQRLEASTLAGVDALIISGAFQPLTVEEVAAVREFVTRGGGLAVMLHIAPPLAGLLHAFDVDFANRPLQEKDRLIDGKPQNFRVLDLTAHSLTAGLTDFAVYGAWALRGMAPGVDAVARTGANSWVDLNQDGQLGPGDAVQSFGVAVAGTPGRGRFVVFGDDALFQNRFLEGNNLVLAGNLARWLPSVPLP